jgi:pimeloyl-ACP methyl ester carboxylesterase
MIHGGGGQGLDYLGTPDGRPGWATIFLQQGYQVYVVDRPGHGRAPFHPDVLGPLGRAATYEWIRSIFIPATNPNNPFKELHTQWPGDAALDQFMASSGFAMADMALAHQLWQERGAELLERIGPAILITHSAGGPMGWLVADARPSLVKAIIACEPVPAWGMGPMLQLPWGLAAVRLGYDPPVSDPSELRTVEMPPLEPGQLPFRLLAEPGRRLPSLDGIPIALVTSEAGSARQRDPGTVALLRQLGAQVDHLELWKHGVRGNGHLMMGEKNNREVAEVLFRWLDAHLQPGQPGTDFEAVPAVGR